MVTASPKTARRQAWLLVALISATALLAPLVPFAGVGLGVLFAAAWWLSEQRSRDFLAAGVHRYHAPPFARACDCATALVRHLGRALAERRAAPLVDAALALAFFVTILAAILSLELSHDVPSLSGAAIGFGVGLVTWHVVVEALHQPERTMRYRGETWFRDPPLALFAATLLTEIAVFVVLDEVHGLDHDGFWTGLLSGIAVIGLGDAATLQSTLLAMVLGGRPLVGGRATT